MFKKALPLIFLIIAMLTWGTTFIVSKDLLSSVGAGFAIFIRGLCVFVIFLPLAIKGLKGLKFKDYLFIFATGLMVALGYVTQIVGLKFTTASKSAFLENAYCIIVPIITCILLRKKPTFLTITCILLCVAGIVFIFLENIDAGFGIGELLSLIAGLFFGVNIAFTGMYSKKYNPITYTWIQFTAVAIVGGIYCLCFENLKEMTFNFDSIWRLAYLGLIATAFSWLLRNYAQRELSPITIGLILPFSAVVSTLISLISGREKLSVFFVIGALFILAAIILDCLKDKFKKKESTK